MTCVKQELLAVSSCVGSGAASDSVMDTTLLTLEALLQLMINEKTRLRFLKSGLIDVILPLLRLESLQGPKTISIKIAALSMVAYALISMDYDIDAEENWEQVSLYSTDLRAANAVLAVSSLGDGVSLLPAISVRYNVQEAKVNSALSICSCGFLSRVVMQMNQQHLDVKHLCACILYLVLSSRNKKVNALIAEVDLKVLCVIVGRSILHIAAAADDATSADQPAAARCLMSLLGYASLLVT